MSTKIRVAILEDHQIVIDGYLYRLTKSPNIEIADIAMTGEDLAPMLDRTHADVLLLDISVPISKENRNPIPIQYRVQMLRKNYPNLRILIISVLEDRALIEMLRNMGIAGYIFKSDQAAIQTLVERVEWIAGGGTYFSDIHGLPPTPPGNLPEPLSPGELKILSLCITEPDKSTTEIAHELGVAPQTIRNQLANCYRKLEVHNRAAAIVKAKSLGLFDTPSSDNDTF